VYSRSWPSCFPRRICLNRHHMSSKRRPPRLHSPQKRRHQ